mgnify:CR=1 FL=1
MNITYINPDNGDTFTEAEMLQEFDNFLNDMHKPVTVVGVTMSPSNVLKKTDSIAYRTQFNDWTGWSGFDEN